MQDASTGPGVYQWWLSSGPLETSHDSTEPKMKDVSLDEIQELLSINY